MSKPYTKSAIALTPKTANVMLKVDANMYLGEIKVTGSLGFSPVDFKMTASELRHFAEFFTMQARRLGKKK